MRHSSIIRQRPDWFTLDKTNPLARGLVFAGLGRVRGSTRYHDSSPYGNHGTLTGFATPAASWSRALGRAVLGFAGDDDYTTSTFPFLSPPLTLSAWYLSALQFETPTSDYYRAIMSRGAVFANNTNFAFGYRLGYSTFDRRRVFCYWKNATTLYGNESAIITTFSANTWHHAAASIDASYNLILYYDGAVVGTDGSNNAPTDGGQALRVGGPSATSAYETYAYGSLSDTLIHNRVLSLAEIQQLADPSNVMLSGLILPPRRRLFASAGGAPATNRRRRLIICSGA